MKSLQLLYDGVGAADEAHQSSGVAGTISLGASGEYFTRVKFFSGPGCLHGPAHGRADGHSPLPQAGLDALQPLLRLPVRLRQEDSAAVDELVGRGLPARFVAPLMVLLDDPGCIFYSVIGDAQAQFMSGSTLYCVVAPGGYYRRRERLLHGAGPDGHRAVLVV